MKLKNRLQTTIIALVVVLAMLQAAAANNEKAFIWSKTTGMQALPGGTFSEAYGINNIGQVVGYTTNGQTHAVVWNPTCGVNCLNIFYRATDIGTLPGGNSSTATAISTLGTIAGYGNTANGQTHAVVWNHTLVCIKGIPPEPNGPCNDRYVPTDLGTPQEGTSSTANGIDDSGQIAGYGNNAKGQFHAIVWNKVGTYYSYADLGTLPGGTSSYATAISNVSGLVEIAGYGNTINGQTHAVVWTQVGTIYIPGWTKYVTTDLGTLPGGTYSHATAIMNVSGLVEIAGYGNNAKGQEVGIVWRPLGSGARYMAIPLGTLPGGTHSEAYGGSNSNQIVGSGGNDAVLWTPFWLGYNSTDLGTLPGFRLPYSIAHGVNDKGLVVGVSGSMQEIG